MLLQDLWKHVFMGKITEEKGSNKKKLHNYTEHFKSGLISHVKETNLKVEFQKLNLRLGIFVV